MRKEIALSDFFGNTGGPAKRHLDGLTFRFYPYYKLNKERSAEVGYPQHDPIDFIEIITQRGERTCRAIQEKDIQAYPNEYAKFKAREEKPVKGMYLREWCMINPSGLADLEAYGLKTLEELAAVPDEELERCKFLVPWFKAANAWIKNAKSKQAECARLQITIDEMQKRFTKLEEQHIQALRRIEANEGNRFGSY